MSEWVNSGAVRVSARFGVRVRVKVRVCVRVFEE